MKVAKPKVLLTRRWPEVCEQKAEQLFDVVLNETDKPLSADQLKQAMCEYDAICPTVSDVVINQEIFGEDSRQCRILANFGVGYNNIDADSAKQAGVVVTNTPGVLTDCTADIALSLMLMVARRAGEGERHVRSRAWGGWRPTHMLGTKLSGKRLGLIGFGRIAQAVVKRAHFGFDMEIYFYDICAPSAEVVDRLQATQCETIEAVMEVGDFVSLHCPGGGDNVKLINAHRLGLMQQSAFLINTARGDVVDEKALIEALQTNTIAGAGLDVYEKEPTVGKALLSMDNVVLFPHLGSATQETRAAMGFCAIDNLRSFFDGKTLPNRVL